MEIEVPPMVERIASRLERLDPDTQPPQELLEEEQGALGLLAGDEEALLRAYRRLDFSTKAAALQVMLKMAGPEPEPVKAGRRKKS